MAPKKSMYNTFQFASATRLCSNLTMKSHSASSVAASSCAIHVVGAPITLARVCVLGAMPACHGHGDIKAALSVKQEPVLSYEPGFRMKAVSVESYRER